jgi:hypothetical protein
MRSQSALEYLMTYGWSILVGIIVGASLYELGVFNPGTFTGQKSTGFSSLHMGDFKFGTTGNLTLHIGNMRGRTINITNITAEYLKSDYYYGGGDCINNTIGPNDECIAIVVTELTQSPGTTYELEIMVNFTDMVSTINHTDFGMISGSVEPA